MSRGLDIAVKWGFLEPGNARKLKVSRTSPLSNSIPSCMARVVATVSQIRSFESGLSFNHPFGGQRDTGRLEGRTITSSSAQFLRAGGKSGIHPYCSSVLALIEISAGSRTVN